MIDKYNVDIAVIEMNLNLNGLLQNSHAEAS